MDSLRQRITRSIAQRGVLGTIPMCWWSLCSLLRPAARRLERQREEADALFDREHGVDTGGVVRPGPEAVIGPHWAHGISYQAVDANEFAQSLARLEINPPEFTFVDYGCGKGRALLLAARLPFRKVVGVEYCRTLADTAVKNIDKVSRALPCSVIEVSVADAAVFPIPAGPLVLFFFNPFGEAVMKEVVNNVARSLFEQPRPVKVVYFTPYFARLWESAGFKRTADSPAILEWSPP
ncbi:MAG TPA: class I SAM-dependent methyltransferase [Verrucomicrobiae bacterium]|nr:class I SAM-dependent methyltransferase [Verrucomicrobiae bacterium]